MEMELQHKAYHCIVNRRVWLECWMLLRSIQKIKVGASWITQGQLYLGDETNKHTIEQLDESMKSALLNVVGKYSGDISDGLLGWHPPWWQCKEAQPERLRHFKSKILVSAMIRPPQMWLFWDFTHRYICTLSREIQFAEIYLYTFQRHGGSGVKRTLDRVSEFGRIGTSQFHQHHRQQLQLLKHNICSSRSIWGEKIYQEFDQIYWFHRLNLLISPNQIHQFHQTNPPIKSINFPNPVTKAISPSQSTN